MFLLRDLMMPSRYGQWSVLASEYLPPEATFGHWWRQEAARTDRRPLKWFMRHLAKDPKANVVIVADFNESHPVGSEKQTFRYLFQARPPFFDALSSLSGKIRTHADGKAYDRIFLSEGILKGYFHLEFESVEVMEHRHGKGEDRRAYTDHFPAVVRVGLR